MEVTDESWEGSANFHRGKNLKEDGDTFYRQASGIEPLRSSASSWGQDVLALAPYLNSWTDTNSALYPIWYNYN